MALQLPVPQAHHLRAGRTRRTRRPRVLLTVASLLLLTGAVALGVASPPDAAQATVTPSRGFRATVLGWSSWYGSYAMGSSGVAWCIDHGLRAPDPSFRYVPTAAPDLDASTGAAISWIVAAHGDGDAIDAAAVMLAVHDQRRASYPFGVLDVDRLTTHDLAGFGGHEAEVLGRARAVKAEARAHAALRAPFHLTLALTPSGAPEGAAPEAGTAARDVDGRATARLTDAGGRPVVGAGVVIAARGADLDGLSGAATGSDGSFSVRYRVGPTVPGQRPQFEAHALVPDPVPATSASSTVRAQRVVRAAWLGLDAHVTLAPATTTTSTTRTTTTTTAPPTTSTSTSTSASTTSTTPRTVPPASTTSTSTTPSTTSPSTTTSTPGRSQPPTSTAPPAPTTSAASEAVPPPRAPPTTAVGTLPRTGGHTAGWALIGAGLVLLGATLVALARGWAR